MKLKNRKKIKIKISSKVKLCMQSGGCTDNPSKKK